MSISRIGTGIATAALLTSIAALPSQARAQTPDFRIGIAFTLSDGSSPKTGFLVRGGLPTCSGCVGTFEPRYDVYTGFPTTSVWSSTSLEIDAVNGFQGSVTLEVLDLPAGVTSHTAPSVTLDSTTLLCDSYGCWVGATTPLSFTAGATAALAGATVTLRATGGAVVHTLKLPIAVVDQLPPTTLFGVSVVNPVVAGGTTVEAVVSLTRPAPAGGTVVAMSSSHPLLASPPTSVFVPEAATGAIFWIPTSPVPAITVTSIDASLNGQTLSATLELVPPGGPDSLSNPRADYLSSKQQLSVEVTSTSATATVQVWTYGGTLIGTLTNSGGGTYKGQLSWPTFPSTIVLKSSLGGTFLVSPALK
jgi:hypothetical protein